MGQQLAKLVALASSAMCGCSLVYNPNDIPVFDAPPDAEVILDADPTMLELTRASPTVLIEGQGDGGSRSAVLVLHGQHMVQNETKVEIAVQALEPAAPTIEVDNTQLAVAENGNMLAVPVRVPVDAALGAGTTIKLAVTVTQMTPSGPVSKTLTNLEGDIPALTYQALDELTGADQSLAVGASHVFSKIELSGKLSPSGATAPLVVRSTSSIAIAGPIQVSASGQTGGPGGGKGGNGGPAGVGSSPGAPGDGPAGGVASGAGGGFVGSEAVTTLAAPNRGSGGAGGNGGTLGPGGVGGGGGGSVAITAAGDLSVGTIDANGAGGGSGSGIGAGSGGGGSGGVVLLRAGGMVTSGAVHARGAGGSSNGAAGRIRIDAPRAIAVAEADPAMPYRGPTVGADTPLIVRTEKPTLMVVGKSGARFSYYVNNEDGSDLRGPIESQIPLSGTATVVLQTPLFRGINELCLLVEGAAPGSETANCVSIVYLYARDT